MVAVIHADCKHTVVRKKPQTPFPRWNGLLKVIRADCKHTAVRKKHQTPYGMPGVIISEAKFSGHFC